jgi:hypothetical protein
MIRQFVERGRAMTRRRRPSILSAVFGAAGVAAATYWALVAHAWWHYGHPKSPSSDEDDPLLDQVMPLYDIVERHHIRVRAPASLTLKAATEMDLFESAPVRAVFRTRELVLGAESGVGRRPAGLIELAESLGWGVLAEVRGREIVMGAVTQPWLANVVFQPLSADRFRAFDTPDFVKIAWTLRADPDDKEHSIFRTETRAMATDAGARAKFRRYWSFVSPGVWLIRRMTLRPVRRSAERRSRPALGT